MSSLVWSTTPEHAKTLVNLSEDVFIDAVNDGFVSKIYYEIINIVGINLSPSLIIT